MLPMLTTTLALLMTTQVVEAREFGGINGVVKDESGVPVPGATITISGSELAGEKVATSRNDGTYRIDGLAPGEYDLTVEFKGAVVARALVRVALETNTYVAVEARMGATEEIEVVNIRPVIDTTQSAFSTSLSEETIQTLPVGRTYQDVINTIPGVTGRVDTSEGGPGDGNPSVRGEGQYGNNFFIDGVSTRDPATKTFGMNVNFDAIEEIQVYTDGAPAEFGQFTGMVANVVTKDGGDEHHGSAAIFYSQHAFFDSKYDIFSIDKGKEVPTTKALNRSPVFNGTAGGPLIEEKLWYFTAVDLDYNWSVPEGLQKKDAITTYGGAFLGKVTFFPSNALTLRYIFQGNLNRQDRYDAGPFVKPEATSNRSSFSMTHLVTATIAPDDKTSVEARAGFTNINIDVIPTSGDEAAPSVLANGVLQNNANQFDYNDRNRFGGGLTFTRHQPDLLGNHKFRLGGEYWMLVEQREIINTGTTKIDWVDNDGELTGDQRDVGTAYQSGDAGSGLPCTDLQNFSDCAVQEHWVNVGPLGTKVQTAFAFLQDDWSPINNLTINAGVRVDFERGINDAGNQPTTQNLKDAGSDPETRKEGKLGAFIMPAPRVGFAFDPTNDGKTKIAGHYGQYYDLSGANLWSWANERSASGFVRNVRNSPGGNWQWSNTQDPEGHPLIFDQDLTPARMDKVNIGFEREIAGGLAFGVRGILSRTLNLPEDVDVNLDDWYIMNSPIKERNYRALEFTLNKVFDDVWQVYGAYTLQESYGHTPGQFELAPGADSGSDGNNVGVYLDDIGERESREFYAENGYGWLLDGLKGLGRYSPAEPKFYDEAGWYGYLPYHSFHAIKLNGSYTAPFGTKFGLVYEFDSGHAWQKRTFVGFYGFDSFQQGRGTRMMPAVHYVDVRIAHQIGLGTEHQSLEATLDIFNVPGFAQSVTYFENDAPGFGSTLYRQAPRSIRLGIKYRY